MPSFPKPGSVTICEINRDLITAETISDDTSQATYGKLIGKVFSPVPFQLDQHESPSPQPEAEHGEMTTEASVAEVKNLTGTLQGLFNQAVKRIFRPAHVSLLAEIDLCGVSWHQHKDILAFISGPNQVTIRDYEDSEGNDPCILVNESQRHIKAVEWRPNGGRMLSIGCKGGICMWAASYPGNAASVRTGAASFLGTASRGSGFQRYLLIDFLHSHNDEQISALSWSPDGRYLASASYESSSFTVWDVAQGIGTPIRRGLGGISMLKWSPSGDYFFAAKFDGTFYLWETNTWTSEQWSSSSGYVKTATWDPDGRMILVAFSESSTLGSIHFASKPPSLDAHLLPVDLPEISLTGSQGIEKIAWDDSGERLAVSYKGGDDLYKGLVAIYDARRTPLLSASLIGFLRGPGENPKPVAFSFHGKFKQGPLLSVRWSSGFCCTYPLLFRSHVVP